MWETLENYAFLACCFGVPSALAVLLVIHLVRFIRTPNPVKVLRAVAAERGWRDTTSSAWLLHMEGTLDDLPFTIARASSARAGGRGGKRDKRVMVTMPFETTPGCFLVQSPVPALLAGKDGALVSSAFASVLGLALDDARADALRTLHLVPGSSAGAPLATYATDDQHPLRAASAAVVELLSAQTREHPGKLLLYVFEGQLTLSSGSPEAAFLPLIELAAACHRALTSHRMRPLR